MEPWLGVPCLLWWFQWWHEHASVLLFSHRKSSAKARVRPSQEEVVQCLAAVDDLPLPFGLLADTESEVGHAGRLRAALSAVQVSG